VTRDQLTAVGEALYGLRWQAALSRDLNVALRTVQRWDAGERGIPDTLSDDLRALLEQRRIDIDDLLKSI
jgi:hypothetical protein